MADLILWCLLEHFQFKTMVLQSDKKMPSGLSSGDSHAGTLGLRWPLAIGQHDPGANSSQGGAGEEERLHILLCGKQ